MISPGAAKHILISYLAEEEGFIDHPYKDSLGFNTIGYGHNLDARPLNLTFPITMSMGFRILMDDVNDTYQELIPKIPFWEKLDSIRQIVLVDMAFNMGVDGLLKFKRMLKDVESQEFNSAAMEMTNSKWYQQVQRSRSSRLIDMMVHGEKYLTNKGVKA